MSPSNRRSWPSTPRSPRWRASESPSWAIRVASASRPWEEVRPAERLAATGPPRQPHVPNGDAMGGFLHQGKPLGAAAGPVVRGAQRPSAIVQPQGNLSRPAEIEAAFQRANSAGEITLIELEDAGADEGEEQRVRVPRFLRDSRRLPQRPNASPNCPSAPSAMASVVRAYELWIWSGRIAPWQGALGSRRSPPGRAERPRGRHPAPRIPRQDTRWRQPGWRCPSGPRRWPGREGRSGAPARDCRPARTGSPCRSAPDPGGAGLHRPPRAASASSRRAPIRPSSPSGRNGLRRSKRRSKDSAMALGCSGSRRSASSACSKQTALACPPRRAQEDLGGRPGAGSAPPCPTPPPAARASEPLHVLHETMGVQPLDGGHHRGVQGRAGAPPGGPRRPRRE